MNKEKLTELIYDTLMKNENYPQLDPKNVKTWIIERGTNSFKITYGKTTYKITVSKEEKC